MHAWNVLASSDTAYGWSAASEVLIPHLTCLLKSTMTLIQAQGFSFQSQSPQSWTSQDPSFPHTLPHLRVRSNTEDARRPNTKHIGTCHFHTEFTQNLTIGIGPSNLLARITYKI